MIDSWRPWKLDPGFVVMYSKLRLLMTSIMKSDPGFSTMRSTCARGAPVSAANWAAFGTTAAGRAGGACCALAAVVVTNAPAAPAAAPLRKPRRLTEPFLDFMDGLLGLYRTNLQQ